MTIMTESAEHSFTYAHYRELLRAFTGKGYRFIGFTEAAGCLRDHRPFVLMRHDIDFELESAMRMAEVETDAGITATYFFMIRTPHYNVFSEPGSEAVRAILDRGHRLGLHFDCAAYTDRNSVNELAEAGRVEADMLEQWFGHAVEVVSYHRPSSLVLSGAPELSKPRVHTYMKEFTVPIYYVSDSRGRWAHGHPLESAAVQDGKPVHILVHPIWWTIEPDAPFDKLVKYRDRCMDRLEWSMAKNCHVYRRGRFAGVKDD